MWYNIFMEQRSKFVYDCLKEKFPNAACELEFNSNFQLLISVILSAQCTDKRVNEVTKVLFEKYPTAFDLANAKLEDVIKIVKPCGFFNNKAKNIIATSKTLVEKFNGEVPKKLFRASFSSRGWTKNSKCFNFCWIWGRCLCRWHPCFSSFKTSWACKWENPRKSWRAT